MTLSHLAVYFFEQSATNAAHKDASFAHLIEHSDTPAGAIYNNMEALRIDSGGESFADMESTALVAALQKGRGPSDQR